MPSKELYSLNKYLLSELVKCKPCPSDFKSRFHSLNSPQTINFNITTVIFFFFITTVLIYLIPLSRELSQAYQPAASEMRLHLNLSSSTRPHLNQKDQKFILQFIYIKSVS